MNLAIVCVVFHVSVSINDCSFTPGHGNVRFLPATATIVFIGMFSSSDGDKEEELSKENWVGFLLVMTHEMNFLSAALWHDKMVGGATRHTMRKRSPSLFSTSVNRVGGKKADYCALVHKNHQGLYAAARQLCILRRRIFPLTLKISNLSFSGSYIYGFWAQRNLIRI